MAEEYPFANLPAALLDEVLAATGRVATTLLSDFQTLADRRPTLRTALEQRGLLQSDADLPFPNIPTTCAVDGSYTVERLLASDLAVAAAVAVEGLTPPSEQRFWNEPRHLEFVESEEHSEVTATVVRSLMLGHELRLAVDAPHDLVLFDGTLTLPTIYLNQGFSRAREVPALTCSKALITEAVAALAAYVEVLESTRTDKQYAGLPKYSTRREVGRRVGWDGRHDDRALLSMVLRPGELTTPMPLQAPDQPWHIGTAGLGDDRQRADELVLRAVAALDRVHVFYYRPHSWLPALRVEVAAGIADNRSRLSTVVYGLKSQCASPGMMEPYPLYLADRTVKSLSGAVPVFRQAATQHISDGYTGEVSDVFFGMHGYRTEAGR